MEKISEYKVLARKYRPQKFKDLVGQNILVKILSSAIINDRLAHAYILTGVRGVGKTTTARLIAMSINCQKRDKNNAGFDLLDQLQFMHDEGFRSLEDNGMKGRSKQVQNKIVQLKKDHNLKYLVNFGSGEGYHAIGLLKNNYFVFGE